MFVTQVAKIYFFHIETYKFRYFFILSLPDNSFPYEKNNRYTILLLFSPFHFCNQKYKREMEGFTEEEKKWVEFWKQRR